MWSVCASSETGACRRVNEDRALADGTKGLIAVFDGSFKAGAAADVALQMTSQLTEPALARGEQTLKQLAHDIHARVQSEVTGTCATTLLVATIQGLTIRVAHVGDSRAYLLRDDELRQLTTDHTLVQEMVDRGELSAADAGRVANRHVITRALGLGEHNTPDVLEVQARPGDIVLLCTDGVWKHLELEAMKKALREGPFEECAARITQLTASPGQDNSSVAALHVPIS